MGEQVVQGNLLQIFLIFFSNFLKFNIKRKLIFFSLPIRNFTPEISFVWKRNFTSEMPSVWKILVKTWLVVVTIIKLLKVRSYQHCGADISITFCGNSTQLTAFQVKMDLSSLQLRSAVTPQPLCSGCSAATQCSASMNGPLLQQTKFLHTSKWFDRLNWNLKFRSFEWLFFNQSMKFDFEKSDHAHIEKLKLSIADMRLISIGFVTYLCVIISGQDFSHMNIPTNWGE